MNKKDVKVLLMVLICLVVLGIIWKISFSRPGQKVSISVDNHIVKTVNLQNDCYIAVSNDGECTMIKDADDFDGKGNLLYISNGKASVISADCPDKICVGMPDISAEDECIVCMPNKLIITVE